MISFIAQLQVPIMTIQLLPDRVLVWDKWRGRGACHTCHVSRVSLATCHPPASRPPALAAAIIPPRAARCLHRSADRPVSRWCHSIADQGLVSSARHGSNGRLAGEFLQLSWLIHSSVSANTITIRLHCAAAPSPPCHYTITTANKQTQSMRTSQHQKMGGNNEH